MYTICNLFVHYLSEDLSYTVLTKIDEVKTLEEALFNIENYRAFEQGVYKKDIWIVPDEDSEGKLTFNEQPDVIIEYEKKLENGRYGVGWMIINNDGHKIGDTWNYIMPEELIQAWYGLTENDILLRDMENERFRAYMNNKIKAKDLDEEFKIVPEEDDISPRNLDIGTEET